MKIGDVTIPNQVVLAPMAGVTDKAFRMIARKHGCGLVYTEMVSAKALTYKNIKTKALLDIEGEEQPISVQLFGSEPHIMAEAARIAVQEGAKIIDVNMGCPVPKVVKNGEGSALLENPQLAQAIVQAMVSAVDVPITVKMRIGWDRNHIVASEFAKKMEEAGASAVAVHGRTRDQYYSGKADWDIIKEVKANLSIPVIGNGDVWSPEDAKNMLEKTGCDAVMIGRGIMGNPWLISRTLQYLKGEKVLAPPTIREKIRGAIEHLDLTISFKGEDIGVREIRKHLAWYLKGLSHTAPLKDAIFKATKRSQVVGLLEEYLEKVTAGSQ
ncbi:tRNA dihydrouridine synthase DusB [Thermanaerosceptrum fracticalcis]|uniref:tRNA-dihydrouridine synthase n=1 Tax=Thermanaerosceptrum fracticalcis TaxID=1712410 RepID=A0A7G6E5Q3_THEFR|nr:tRNA dihydrouridine synthase DusB [Thermanaerosceptrum fracticalcis]QNB47407.1 tRNA dihydrouridine synthase DusB [Thermanaerosceptrum fracticalcis]